MLPLRFCQAPGATQTPDASPTGRAQTDRVSGTHTERDPVNFPEGELR